MLGDVVAIFHCSFHPTKGNNLDWSRKCDAAPSLDGVEFNALPSGLHALDEDVIHFTKDAFHGICLFQRSESDGAGMRGYQLRSIGILVAQSPRPRPWKHISNLRDLLTRMASQSDQWEPLNAYFESHQSSEMIKETSEWTSWEEEYADEMILNHPAGRITQLICTFGPFFFTVYKHMLGGRRVLIYTLPPVEPVCVLAQVVADLCSVPHKPLSTGNCALGVVTLNDIDRLKRSFHGGWIACSTDKIFFDKPELYDMFIDLSTPTSRPTIYVSKGPHLKTTSARREKLHLHHAKFTWSDVANWDQMDRDVAKCGMKTGPPDSIGVRLNDPWGLYADFCIAFSRLWLGNPRSNPTENSDLARRKSFRETILNPFQRRTSFLLTTLDDVTSHFQSPDASTICLTPSILSQFELGPLSASDARFVEWLGESNGRKVEITRSWKELFCVALGLH